MSVLEAVDQMRLEFGRSVLLQESKAIESCAMTLSDSFDVATKWIIECRQRVITCGIGKSGHVAKKASATFSSTGTPSLFLHAAESVHGDLGVVKEGDVVLMYTQSGETDELVRLFAPFRSQGAQTILITGRPNSSAARLADLTLDTKVSQEACPNNLAPTTSTTVMMALSDALALTVMNERGFDKNDFARFHPSGTLGKRLTLRVRDVMRSGEDMATVKADATVIEVMSAITRAGVGAACIVNEEHELLGFISDGDLRRHFLCSPHLMRELASSIMNPSPSVTEATLLAIEAMEQFQELPKRGGELPVVEQGKLVGLLQLKDLLRCGII